MLAQNCLPLGKRPIKPTNIQQGISQRLQVEGKDQGKTKNGGKNLNFAANTSNFSQKQVQEGGGGGAVDPGPSPPVQKSTAKRL